MAFPFLTIFIVLILFLAYKRKKITDKQNQVDEAFWATENQARITPAVDITNLEYITIPTDKFPLNFSSEPDILALEKEIQELSQKPILNLTRLTNTEVKLKYGMPNFQYMSEVGENYDNMTVALDHYARVLIEKEMIKEAMAVLEFAVGTKTDISSSYISLADCYARLGNTTKLDYLRAQVEASDFTLKSNILSHIDAICQ